jgi:hypothetical protein
MMTEHSKSVVKVRKYKNSITILLKLFLKQCGLQEVYIGYKIYLGLFCIFCAKYFCSEGYVPDHCKNALGLIVIFFRFNPKLENINTV